MRRRTLFTGLCGAAWTSRLSAAAEYRPDLPPPRLLLNSQRLKRLRRERERDSPRWRQFDALIAGKAQLPEPAFAHALHFRVTDQPGSAAAAVKAAQWQTTDVRQTALVYDWCGALIPAPLRPALQARLKAALADDRPTSLAQRDRVFAALALADDAPADASKAIAAAADGWWLGQRAPAIKQGAWWESRADLLATLELLHVMRDNFSLDLREPIAKRFLTIPQWSLLTYMPTPLPDGESLFHIPVTALRPKADPDLREATLARIADFALVALDPNQQESQFVQGWLTHEQFTLTTPLGAPYEFLWANPYQPGLSYAHMPRQLHDRLTGELYLRSSWEYDAAWVAVRKGSLQVFEQGRLMAQPAERLTKPFLVGDAALLRLPSSGFFPQLENVEHYFVLNLPPNAVCQVEIDDEELHESRTDPAGTLPVSVPYRQGKAVRIVPITRT